MATGKLIQKPGLRGMLVIGNVTFLVIVEVKWCLVKKANYEFIKRKLIIFECQFSNFSKM